MVTIILTTMNEVDGLKWLWPRLNVDLVRKILIVDNHSTDGTLEFLSDKPCMVITQSVPGRGNGIREAMNYVEDDVVILMSSDGNDDPVYLFPLIKKLGEEHDIVCGTRFAQGGSSDNSDDPLHIRRFGNKLFTNLVNLLFAANYTDTTYGFRGFKKQAWDAMKINSRKNETEYMMSIRAAKLKMKTAEIPMTEGRRVGGKVKAKTFPTGLSFLRLIFSELT